MNGDNLNIRKSVIIALLTAILGALSMNAVYCVSSIEDCTEKVTEYMSCCYIGSLSPWSGEMTVPMILVGNLGNTFSRFSFSAVILMFCVGFVSYCVNTKLTDMQKKKSYVIATYLTSVVFGLTQVAGMSVHYFSTLEFCLSSTYQMVISFVIALGYGLLYKLAFDTVFLLVCRSKEKYQTAKSGDDSKVNADNTIDDNKRELIISYVVILFVYLVWIAIFFPGSVDWDSHASVDFFLSGNMNQHHPVMTTWIRVLTLKIARKFGNDNIAPAIYVIVQAFIVAYGFTKILWLQQELRCRTWIRRLTAAFFTLVPIFGIFIQSNIKNTLFTGVFVIFVCNLAELLILKDNRKNVFVRTTLSAIWSCLLLNNAIYVVLIILLILAVSKGLVSKQKNYLIVFAIILVFNISFNMLCTDILKYDKISENGAGEAYSLPCLCTAYLLKTNMDTIPNEEKEILSRVFTCDMQTLANGYIYGLSDGVKGNWNNEAPWGDKLSYFVLWIKQGIRHPVTYAEAILNQSYGYYVLAPTDDIRNADKESYMNYQMEYSEYSYHVSYVNSDSIRDLLSAFTHLFERNPFTGIITNQGLATWIIMSSILIFAFLKDNNSIYISVLLLLYILTCVASPVNGNLRYYLPIFGAMPVMWGLIEKHT